MKRIKSLLKEFRYIFDKDQKMKFVLLLILTFGTTLLELLGVAAVMPLVNVIMSPDTIMNTWYLNYFYTKLEITNTNVFIAVMGIAIIIVYVVKNVAVSIMYYLQYYYTFSNQRKLAGKMMSCYLKQSYDFHLQSSSAELIRNIDTDIAMLFQGTLAILQLITEVGVCTVLGIYLLIKDKSITVGLSIFLIIFILLFAKRFKGYLTRIGNEDRYYKANIVKWLQQSFAGMKETKILGRERFFYDNFNQNYENWAERERKYRFLQVIPRPVLEMTCIVGMMSIVVLKLLNGTTSDYFISTIAIFAVAAFRLLPSINRITNSMSVVMFNIPAFDAVYDELKEIEKMTVSDWQRKDEVVPLVFNKEIKISNISFKYPGRSQNVLTEVNIEIKKNQTIAFIGPSGVGKTTLADIILGILEPTEGKILIDGKDAIEHRSAWQKNIGYIPQNIYLMDDTIENNIYYGAVKDKQSEERLWKSIEQAQLKDYVLSLESGAKTLIGESGIRLSGGQRQRIGIARALYNDPAVLVLDEATSALDNDTEAAVMEAIENLTGNKTLIIIAHRLSTIQNCDIVYEIKDGKVRQTEKPVV